MPDHAEYNQLARQYGLEEIPESVLKLTQLVARQDCDLGEIAQLIDQEPMLRTRLLRLANPLAKRPSEYEYGTVEAAIFRQGIGCALVLAMCTPLAFALAKTFQAMLGLKLMQIDPYKAKPIEPPFVIGIIGFAGKSAGLVALRMGAPSAAEIAGTVLGVDPKDMTDPQEVNDVVGELCNIITGNFKSNLCDAGLDCRLQPPRVMRANEPFSVKTKNAGLEHLAFEVNKITLAADLAINPWNEE